MSVAIDFGRAIGATERANRSNEFVRFALFLAQAKGRGTEAADRARRAGMNDRLVGILEQRAAGAGTITGGGAALAPYKLLAESFISSIGAYSALDTIGPSCVQLPVQTRVVVTSTPFTASTVNEASTKPTTALALDGLQITPTKVSAVCVISAELAQLSSPAATSLLGTELRKSIGAASDAEFISVLAAATQSTPSTGNFADDVATALDLIDPGVGSKLFVIAAPSVIRSLSFARGTGGSPLYPAALVDGGNISGIPLVPSSALSGEAFVIDASGIAVDLSGVVQLDYAEHANLDMDGGDSPALSLWQKDLRAIRVERSLGIALLRQSSVAIIAGSVTA